MHFPQLILTVIFFMSDFFVPDTNFIMAYTFLKKYNPLYKTNIRK